MPLIHNEKEFFPFKPEPDGEFFDTQDYKQIRGALWEECKHDGFAGNPMAWEHRESVLSILMEARLEAHEIAKRKKIDVEAAWSKTRLRVRQDTEHVLRHPVTISTWHNRIFKQAFAIASIFYPHDARLRFEAAQQIAMEHSDSTTEEAWLAFTSYHQESLFDDSVYVTNSSKDESHTLLDVIADETSTGEDPAAIQTSFLDYALSEESVFTERQKDIIELLAYEDMSNRQIAEKLGITDMTVHRDIKAIRLSGATNGWLPDIGTDEEEEKKAVNE